MATKFIYRLGIDPAWKNLGVSLVREDVETGELSLVRSTVMNPSGYPTIPLFVSELHHWVWNEILGDRDGDEDLSDALLESVTIERFVAYAGVSTAETENICMIIGGLQQAMFAEWGCHSLMLRAIDWKTTLVKELFKRKGFENPSVKLDKKFSIAAAKACLDEEVKFATDHEADATCLAAYPVMTRKNK